MVLLRLKFKTLIVASKRELDVDRPHPQLLFKSHPTLSKHIKHQCSGLTVPSARNAALPDVHNTYFLIFFGPVLKGN